MLDEPIREAEKELKQLEARKAELLSVINNFKELKRRRMPSDLFREDAGTDKSIPA